MLKIPLIVRTGHSLPVSTTPGLSAQLHPLSPVLHSTSSCACCEAPGFPYEWLGVWNSVCEHLVQNPHSHPLLIAHA